MRIISELLKLSSSGLKDARNFHIITDKKLILKRRETGIYSIKVEKEWELKDKDSIIIKGNYDEVIKKFVEEYNKREEVI